MANDTTFVIPEDRAVIYVERRFDAPAERVFDAHVDAVLIPQWWGPRRLTTRVEILEPRHGGRWRYVQTDLDGSVYPFRGVFHHVERPHHIVSTFEFEDESGAVQLNDLRLTESGTFTVLRQTTVFLSVADRDGMVHAGMRDGHRETLERLEELCAT
jgi:uncharacterized protein YndB with AHSA1/START domain